VLLVLVQEAVEGLLERSVLVILLGGGGEAVQQVVGNVDNNVCPPLRGSRWALPGPAGAA
jgi:hypothetical protein